MNTITTFLDSLLSNLGSNIGPMLTTLILLIAGIMVAAALKKGTFKLLTTLGVDEKIKKAGTSISLAKLASTLVHSIAVIFVLLFVLERMGITSVLDPLKSMVNDFVSVIPNLLGACIIAYAGWLIATVVSSIVAVATSKLDSELDKRGIEIEFKLSKFLSAFVFGGILIPIIIVSLTVLDIQAVSDPATQMLNELASTVPNIVGAGIILLVAYFIAKFINFLLGGLLEGMNLNQLPGKIGLPNLFGNIGLIKFIQGTVSFFILMTAFGAAVEKLNILIVSDIFRQIISFGGDLLKGGVILVIGYTLANIVASKLQGTSKLIASIARFTILGLIFSMGVREMGLAEDIVNTAFTLTLGAAAVSFALAFGLGGRETAGQILQKWFFDKK